MEGYPPVPPEALALLKNTHLRIKKFRKVVTKIEKALFRENDIIRAQSLSKPYAALSSPEFIKIEKITSQVGKVLDECKIMAFKKTKSREFAQLQETPETKVDRPETRFEFIARGAA